MVGGVNHIQSGHLARLILDGCCDGRVMPQTALQALCERVLEKTTGLSATSNCDVDAQFMANMEKFYRDLVGSHPPFTDLLGPVYMELASHGHRSTLQQYFTPWPIAKMMSVCMFGEKNARDSRRGDLYRAIDPAAGSGIMMLAAANTLYENDGVDGLNRWSLSCVDLDRTCALIAAAQFTANLSVYNLTLGELIVIHGNSLWPDECWNVILHAASPQVSPIQADHCTFKDKVQQLAREQHESLFSGSALAS